MDKKIIIGIIALIFLGTIAMATRNNNQPANTNATGGYLLDQIRKIINSIGLVGKKGKMLSVSNYQYMLKNKIYYRIIEYNGELYDGKHEPIITKKLFDTVQ